MLWQSEGMTGLFLHITVIKEVKTGGQWDTDVDKRKRQKDKIITAIVTTIVTITIELHYHKNWIHREHKI